MGLPLPSAILDRIETPDRQSGSKIDIAWITQCCHLPHDYGLRAFARYQWRIIVCIWWHVESHVFSLQWHKAFSLSHICM